MLHKSSSQTENEIPKKQMTVSLELATFYNGKFLGWRYGPVFHGKNAKRAAWEWLKLRGYTAKIKFSQTERQTEMNLNPAYQFALEKNSPIIAREMIELADECRSRRIGGYVVIALAYKRSNSRVTSENTPRKAFRMLASMIAGKRKQAGEFAACVVTPDNRVINYTELKGIIK